MKIGNIECYGIIYKITNLVNGKCYIGQTTNGFKKRYSSGISNTHNVHLKNSINEYGIENFEINEKLDIAFSKEELDIKEKHYIKLFDSANPSKGYNLTFGGANYLPTEETRRKISDSLMGHDVSEETKQKISEKAKLRVGELNPFYGRKHSEETKEKNRQSHLGKRPSEEAKRKMSENHWDNSGENHPMYGKHHSEETRKRISENHAWKGKKRPEHSEKIKGKNNCNAKAVICITTNMVFDTATEAVKYYGINSSGVVDCCKGRQKSAGKLPNGTKLVWRYLTIIEL